MFHVWKSDLEMANMWKNIWSDETSNLLVHIKSAMRDTTLNDLDCEQKSVLLEITKKHFLEFY